MGLLKRFILIPILVSLAALSLSAATFTKWEDFNTYNWNPNPNSGGFAETVKKPLLGFYGGVDDGTRPFLDSFLRTASPEQPVCDGFDDPECHAIIRTDNRKWWTWSMLGPCATPSEPTKCIETVRIRKNDGEYRNLVLDRVLAGVSFPADPKHGLEAGSTASIWLDPLDTRPDRGYLLAVGGGLKVEGPASNPKKAYLDFVEANIIPFTFVTGLRGFGPNHIFISPGNGYRAIALPGASQCIWSDVGECGVQTEFEPDTQLELTLHLPGNIAGWVFGRLDSPQVKATNIAKQSKSGFPINRITVSAKPVNVPLYSIKVPIENASKKLKAAFANPKVSPCLTTREACSHGWAGGSTSGGGEAAFELFDMFEGFHPQSAQLLLPRWSFNTQASEFESKEFAKCRAKNKNELLGFVTTNATNYLGSEPEFKGGFLNYKVAALHSLPNGEDFIGSYDLVLNSDFARCLYGFSKAPISASVSVTNAKGKSQIATTLVSEKYGWINLSAKNFTFSSPTVKIKLTQKKS